ncbi:MAG: TIGR03086 family protein, partial [Actinomycetota bacterium]|nr:TIGR03086 family protein [Actinomycetota bacterium]
WDVARAIGAPFSVDPDLQETALGIALAVPDSPGRRHPGAAFAPAITAAARASVLDRILAHLGRSPTWPH